MITLLNTIYEIIKYTLFTSRKNLGWLTKETCNNPVIIRENRHFKKTEVSGSLAKSLGSQL